MGTAILNFKWLVYACIPAALDLMFFFIFYLITTINFITTIRSRFLFRSIQRRCTPKYTRLLAVWRPCRVFLSETSKYNTAIFNFVFYMSRSKVQNTWGCGPQMHQRTNWEEEERRRKFRKRKNAEAAFVFGDSLAVDAGYLPAGIAAEMTKTPAQYEGAPTHHGQNPAHRRGAAAWFRFVVRTFMYYLG